MQRVRRLAFPALMLLAAFAFSGCRRTIEVKGATTATDIQFPAYQSWPSEPVFEVIPGTGIKCLASYEGRPVGPEHYICRVGRHWYWAYKGNWFVSRKSWRGRWKQTLNVPAEFLRIPASDPHHVLATLHPDYRK